MRRLISAAVLSCAVGLLAACQPSLPGKASQGVTPNAVTGDAIETTALDAQPGAADKPEVAPEAATAAGSPTAAAQTAPQATPAAAPATAEPMQAEPVEAAAEPAPKPDMTEIPVTPKSEKQLACEKKKGKWAKVGKGDAHACVYMTRDSTKRCERESQCESVCLARSGTCAPFKPMYGCNEILQDNGARVTLCLD